MFKSLFFIVLCFVTSVTFVVIYPEDTTAIITTFANLEIVADVKDLFMSIDYAGIWEGTKKFFTELTS